MLDLQDINSQEYHTFVENFSNIVEHSPLIAGTLWSLKPFKSVDHFILETRKTINSMPEIMQEGILRMYPDLAGRLAKSGQLGVESTQEHSAAKLDQMTSDEKIEMANLNQSYKDKFGFPFIICVRLNKKEAIFGGLRTRLHNDRDQELQNGIKEVLKITELRIRDIIFDDSFKIMSRI